MPEPARDEDRGTEIGRDRQRDSQERQRLRRSELETYRSRETGRIKLASKKQTGQREQREKEKYEWISRERCRDSNIETDRQTQTLTHTQTQMGAVSQRAGHWEKRGWESKEGKERQTWSKATK